MKFGVVSVEFGVFKLKTPCLRQAGELNAPNSLILIKD